MIAAFSASDCRWPRMALVLVVVAWLYVVVLMTAAEALSSQGSVLGALMTFVGYGVLPLVIVMYIMGTPARRRARAAEAARADAASPDGDGGGHAAGGAVPAVAPERKEG